MTTFAELQLNENIKKAIAEMGFETPTPIQQQTIPHLLETDQDLMAFAQTGTGKTAAFGLPAVHKNDTEIPSIQTIILCPTRELCLQITKDLQNFSKYIPGLSVVPIYGGASIQDQSRALRKGAHIVVATPGRAKDFLDRKKLIVDQVQRLILDEADEMLTMGFKDEIDAILKGMPKDKQTILFSATMSPSIINIAKKYMNDPKEIAAARQNTSNENVSHSYYMVHARDKYEVLKRLTDSNPKIYGIVFCRTRRETNEVANKLMHDGYNAEALHGDLSQAQRDEVMGRFRTKHVQILVATDVAARGLDVNDLTHVINFSLPDDTEVYIHRSGRTGRAGKKGKSIAIIHTREMRPIRAIEKVAGIRFTRELVPKGKEICATQLYSLVEKIQKVEVNEEQISPFMDDVYKTLDGLSKEELIKHFVSAEFNRFLAYYKDAKDINVSGEQRDEPYRQRRDNKRFGGRSGGGQSGGGGGSRSGGYQGGGSRGGSSYKGSGGGERSTGGSSARSGGGGYKGKSNGDSSRGGDRPSYGGGGSSRPSTGGSRPTGGRPAGGASRPPKSGGGFKGSRPSGGGFKGSFKKK